jgi:hypothetical protein
VILVGVNRTGRRAFRRGGGMCIEHGHDPLIIVI